MVPGTLGKAITQQLLTKRSLYHIHWEESLFSRCTSVSQAIRVRSEYVKSLQHYVDIGGKIVWTLHNVKPHECTFVQTLFSLRRDLATLAHLILVHNQTSLSILQSQTGMVDLSKVKVLPHPSYFDIYEASAQTVDLAGGPPARARTLLHFGLVREYKGIPDLVRKLPQQFMKQHGLELHICGKPLRADSFLDKLLADNQERPEIRFSLHSVPNTEVAETLRSHAGLILPYHKVVTSGVAVLGLTLGVPTVAPNTSAMRELFPESAHHLLFNPRSSRDLRRAAVELIEMPLEVRRQIARDYIERALLHHPQIISRRLGELYGELLGLTDDGPSDVAMNRLWADRLACNDLISSPVGKLELLDDAVMQSRVPSLFQLNSERETMATRAPKAATAARSNEQLALELVKATLLGSVRTSIPDELILNNIKDANKITVERSRLDGAYAVRLYTDILGRLNKQSQDKQSTDNGA